MRPEVRIEARPPKNPAEKLKVYTYLNPYCTLKCLGLEEGSEERSNNLMDRKLYCDCGDSGIYEWTWTKEADSSVALEAGNREITFHPVYSAGTAALRGRVPFQKNRHHFWEMKMLSNLYGTDVMVGVGTDQIQISEWRYRFLSLLGVDDQSWGYSYNGNKQHAGSMVRYGSKFGFGSLIGVHLDMYTGKLEFYMNRKPLGIAYTGLKLYKQLYPMVSSTAALSSMKLTCALSTESSLQLTCLQAIIKQPELYRQFKDVPGLRRIYEEKFFWMLPKEVEVEQKPKEAVSPSKRRKIYRPMKMHFYNCDKNCTEQ